MTFDLRVVFPPCSYVFNSGSMVKASSLTFTLKPLRNSLDEVRVINVSGTAATVFTLGDSVYRTN